MTQDITRRDGAPRMTTQRWRDSGGNDDGSGGRGSDTYEEEAAVSPARAQELADTRASGRRS